MSPTIMPFGARIFVDDLEPEVSLVKRGQAAGLHIVVLEGNEPKPTSGIVRAVGTDPLLQEYVKVGDIVTFARHAGVEQSVEGHVYRCLEMREIIAVIKADAPPTQATAPPTASEASLCPQGSEDPGPQPGPLAARPSDPTET